MEQNKNNPNNPIANIINLTKKRGFFYPSSSIYEPLAGVYDYGPLGTKLLENVLKLWRTRFNQGGNTYEINSSLLTNRDIWKASGHLSNFKDPMVRCKKTGKQFRVDHLLCDVGVSITENATIEELTDLFHKHKDKFHLEGVNVEDLTEPAFTSQLVSTDIKIQKNKEEHNTYLRGETCQGIFVNYKNIMDTIHPKLPFAISQIGKVFRNEIAPRQFLFRLREFQQMELEYFCKESDADNIYKTLKKETMDFIQSLGINTKNLRFKDHEKLVFYACSAVDIEYKYDDTWRELCGIHNRGDYDLSQHSKHSNTKLNFFDESTKESFIPFIIESSIGVERLIFAILLEAYTEEEVDGEKRVVLKIDKKVAPYSIAVLPLQKKDGLDKFAYDLYQTLQLKYKDLSVIFDDSQSIGKRYRRQDEIGTPYCVTIDYDSIKDKSVTVRNRDTMKQERVAIVELPNYFNFVD